MDQWSVPVMAVDRDKLWGIPNMGSSTEVGKWTINTTFQKINKK